MSTLGPSGPVSCHNLERRKQYGLTQICRDKNVDTVCGRCDVKLSQVLLELCKLFVELSTFFLKQV